MNKISVIGLGKLGACTATCFAKRGFDVIGVDVLQRNIDAINAGQAPVVEPRLQELIAENQSRLRATSDYDDAILNTDATFIIVPTPTDHTGGFSVKYATAAAREIGKALAKKDSYHLVVLTSTVLPGDTEKYILPVLEEMSGKKAGVDFGLCYSPEFIAIGSVITDFLNPDFGLIGELDTRSGDALEAIYNRTWENGAPNRRMNIVSAEMTKISVNTYVTTKITFANMLAEICEQIPGADVDMVTNAMGTDVRIGRKYLTAGVSFGGPCFPRDNVAFAYLAGRVGANGSLAEATHSYNLAHRMWLFEQVQDIAGPRATVGVVGLAYRPGAPIVEEAAGMDLVRKLVASGHRVVVWEGTAIDAAKRELSDTVRIAESIREVADSVDVMVLVSEGEPVKSLTSKDIVRANGTAPVVVDTWRVCAAGLGADPRIDYRPLGRGTAREAAALIEAAV